MLVTWIGHATVLVQTQGLNILTDPVWASRDSPVQFAGPRRVRRPGVRLVDLPRIDLVLISHTHFDHLDLRALRWMHRRDRPTIVAGLGVDRLLARSGLTARVGDWGDTLQLRPGLAVTLLRAHHWSAHGLHDRDETLWTGFRIDIPGADIYYVGDSGPGDMRWFENADGGDGIRLALIPIGPYSVRGRSTGNHIDPEQAAQLFRSVGASYALGVHWGTFELSDEPIDGPPRRLKAELERLGMDVGAFRTIEAGSSWWIPK